MSDQASWHVITRLEKFRAGAVMPYETIEVAGNQLMNGGVSCIWEALIGNGNTTPGDPLAYFDATNGHLGVGDSTTPSTATQTDLQAATNKFRQVLDAAPTHTDGTTSTANSITFIATFGTADANFSWNEWGIFNDATAGRMLNRKVQNFGTKTAADSWVLSVTVSIT